MRRWITTVVQGESHDSVSKAREDVLFFSRKMDYKPLYIYRYYDDNESEYALHSRIDGITAGVAANDLVVYQYPSYNGLDFDTRFISRMNAREIDVCLWIHDIEYLRGASDQIREVALLNQAQSVIIHGSAMKKALLDAGVVVPLILKELFDYRCPQTLLLDPNTIFENKVTIAGNLHKSPFLKNWQWSIPIFAFGDGLSENFSANVYYQGSYAPEELVYHLPRDTFGLAWDEDLAQGGAYGQYTRYNSPHKISLYIALGMPVIVWEESAIAQIVKRYNIGLTIRSLDEIENLICHLSIAEKIQMKQNVTRISKQLTNGLFTRKSLLSAELIALESKEEGSHLDAD
ncbi:hypothetical protein [uncultured Enterococcus sp.]|uniref:hypothetical protein n=1 Tax=uncultured Enterococcus sp. TaxID=167972 RepID=UPI0025FD31E6|nr:hypothetical protein [uncultured Enterococcus sp.]